MDSLLMEAARQGQAEEGLEWLKVPSTLTCDLLPSNAHDEQRNCAWSHDEQPKMRLVKCARVAIGGVGILVNRITI